MQVQVKGLTECKSASDVRALARRTILKSRAFRKPRPKIKIHINDLTPGPIPICVKHIIDYQTRSDLLPDPIRYPSVASIIGAVCRRYNASKMDLVSQRRTASVVLPRQIVCALARKLTPLSLPLIGRHLGNRDHTTVLHACNKVDRMRAERPDFDAELLAIEGELGCHKPFERLTTQVREVRISPWSSVNVAQTFEYLLRMTSLSYERIAATLNGQFGTNLSKNACLARARRLGITRKTLDVSEAA